MICNFNKSLGLPGFSCCRDDRQLGGLWLARTDIRTDGWKDGYEEKGCVFMT